MTEINNTPVPVVINGNGQNTAYLDAAATKPVDVVAATGLGAVTGFITGAMGAGFIAIAASERSGRNGPLIAAAAGFTIVTTALGAIFGNRQAKIHNQWAERVTKATLENHQAPTAQR